MVVFVELAYLFVKCDLGHAFVRFTQEQLMSSGSQVIYNVPLDQCGESALFKSASIDKLYIISVLYKMFNPLTLPNVSFNH